MKVAHRRNVRQRTKGANRADKKMPFGTSAEKLVKKSSTSADDLAGMWNIWFDSRTTSQSANMLWQYLAEVGLLQGESYDEEFVASFALQFLVMEYTAAWCASHANIVKSCLGK